MEAKKFLEVLPFFVEDFRLLAKRLTLASERAS